MEVKKVLISQPAPAVREKSQFHEVSVKYGLCIDYHPFIRVEGLPLKEFRSQRVDLLRHTAVLFNSRTTVDNFFRICEEARITPPETMKYICSTEAVALYLQKYIVYRKRKIFFSNGTFNGFMELIVKHRDEKFLLALSEPHNPEIPSTMERLKLDFTKLILARTVPNEPEKVCLTDYDMTVLYSPTEVAVLVGAFGTENLPMIATFGDGTAKAAVEAGLAVSVMAPSPEAPSMSKALDLFLNRLQKGEKPEPVTTASHSRSEEFIKAQQLKPVRRPRTRRKPAAVPRGAEAKK